MDNVIILAVIVGFVFTAYFIIRFLFGLVCANLAPEETAAETAHRRAKSLMGVFTVACLALALWFLQRGINPPMTLGSWSPWAYYFWAFVIGIGGALGGLLTYLEFTASKPCPFCGQNVRKDAVRCNHCGADLDFKP